MQRSAAGGLLPIGNLPWAVLIGIVSGLASAAFREANVGLQWLLTGASGDIVRIAEQLSPAMRIGLPTLGGVLAGLVLALGARLFKGQPAPDYLEAIHLGDGTIAVRPTLAKLVSSLLSISSGASIGREGGMVQLAAMLASAIGQRCRLSRPRLRLLVACGGAAGLASAYDTPLAGALFIAEIVLQSLAIEALGPLVVAAVTATLVIRRWIGVRPFFATPGLDAPSDAAILPVLGLGLLAGILAPAFLDILDRARRGFHWLNLPLPLSLGLGGLIVGLISIMTPEVWGNGHGAIAVILNASPARDFVVDLLLLKVLATAAATGSGAVGGVFTPSLSAGAAIGWLYAQAVLAVAPGLNVDAVTFAALGMGAFLAGTTHAPVMAILMIFEMTLDARLLLPLIVAAVVARFLAAAIRPCSIYAHAMGERKSQAPYLLQVADLMALPAAVVTTEAMAEAMRVRGLAARYHWVVDEAGRYRGAIVPAASHSLTGHCGPEPHRTAARRLLYHRVPTIGPGASLTEALTALVRAGTDRLPVVGADGVLLGEITRDAVLRRLP